MRGCHSMVPILQCIDTTTIRALRRPVSKEVWDSNSACCMSNIPWRLGSTKRKTRAEYRRGFSPGMACIMYGIKYRNICLSALVEIFYSLDLRGNGDLLEKNRLGRFECLRRAAEPQLFCVARLAREEPGAREWPGRMFGDMMQCTSVFSTTLKACYLFSL
ncbi:uncharacterized protein K444DRAFT_162482 [Hyaloscypha bicolor E]|uniref:Uncharacterized protein n=1 Tax=Hyaloscypha bicolor E TaxID=1095630 RepID=A0A2J6TST7_9HELO|nr:uncharacterized protein K444DRAFT_162482 [Hyaloscypha bicolor E]PMD66080.1 hypothetical protein K444DRAFT_162482 [Hyaloscypha bicolor E]